MIDRRRTALFLALVGVSWVCGIARATQGRLGDPDPARCDLVVLGSLAGIDGGLALAGGAVHEWTRAALDVERVLYGPDGEALPAQVRLYADRVGDCPSVPHEARLGQRGIWLLRRTELNGVYTAEWVAPARGPTLLQHGAPRVRCVRAWLDPHDGTVVVALRHENLAPGPAVFSAPVTLVVEARDAGQDPLEPTVFELPAGELRVSPWRFVEEIVCIPPGSDLRDCTSLAVRPGGGLESDRLGCLVEQLDREAASDLDLSLWLPPELEPRLSLSHPSPRLLVLVGLIGLLPLATGGQRWGWRPRVVWSATLCTTGALSLLPWSVLGLFSLQQLAVGVGAHPTPALAALGVHALTAGMLWRSARPGCRSAVALGAVAPALLVVGSHGLLRACVVLGVE